MKGDGDSECCAICGRALSSGGAFCHFYPEGRPVAFCSPRCAEVFLRGPERCAVAPERDLVEELVEELRWTWGHGVHGASALTRGEHEIASRAEPGSNGGARLPAQPTIPNLVSHENRSCAY